MEPFALKSGRRLQLHWWVMAGLASAFFVWSFDLIPRVRSAATGTVANTNPAESKDSWIPESESPFHGEWSPEFGDSSESASTPHSMRSEDPFPSLDSTDSTYGEEERDSARERATVVASGPSQRNHTNGTMLDSQVTAVSYETDRAAPSKNSSTRSSNQVIPANVADQLRNIDEWLRDEQILDAHAELSGIYWKHPELRDLIQERLDQTAALIFTTSERQFGPPHFVEYGETLQSIAKQYEVPWEYLSMLNRVTPEKLQAGQELKVVRGPFGAVVDLQKFTLTVHAQGWYINHYTIGTGRNQKTPLGEFVVREKLENPTWYNPDGGIVEPDDPENPLGEYWIGLGNHIGIHGTNDPDSIGKAASRGCIHLDDHDIVEVFSLLNSGSKVLIRK